MRKFVILAAVVALAGCTKPPATTTTTTSSTTTPAMMPQTTAATILTSAGYQNPVLGPSQKYPGGWMGTATKNGATVPVTVDASGKIVQ